MSTNKKLLMINNSLTNGGAERVMCMLANELTLRGYEIDMLILNAEAPETYRLDNRVNKIKFNSEGVRGPRFTYKWFKLIRKQQKKKIYDAVISFMMGNNVLTLVAGIGLGQKIIVSERCNPSVLEVNGRLFKIGEQLAYPFAHSIVFQTDDVMKNYKRSIRKKGIVIPNPVNPNLPTACMYEMREKKIVSAGRLTKQKNYPMLLKAFEKFNKKCPGYTLEIYGKGELLDELKTLSKELKIDECVTFAGYVSDVDEHIRNATMFVMSSDYEGISNTMIEALAMGVPTICTDCPVGGARLMIDSGKNGILVPVGDVDAMSEAMIKLAENPQYAYQLGMEALNVRKNYSVKMIVDQWEKIF
ncbi:MAG: glycosyltransferase family 4 protein [Lachnospiraceae bacterium]|nr:glycosyltransferase family 4 protein [Lachnospiraceae bacterium]